MKLSNKIHNSINYRYWNFIHWHFPYLWAKRLYKVELGKIADFSSPRDLNEKIQWLEFFTDTAEWSTLADKYRVRKYVAEKLGDDKILVPLLGKWDTAEEIDFNSLPNQFVIKPNNGSFDCVIVTDKRSADLTNIRKTMESALNSKFGLGNAEPHYLRIKPCIIAEQLLDPDPVYGLIDYKIWCFNGKAHNILVCMNRNPKTHHANLITYDLDWKKHTEVMIESYRNKCECPKPNKLKDMLEIAELLSEGLPECRVDLYNVNGRIYFGELTMTSNYGMMPYYTQDYLNEMGRICTLPVPSLADRFKSFFNRYKPYF